MRVRINSDLLFALPSGEVIFSVFAGMYGEAKQVTAGDVYVYFDDFPGSGIWGKGPYLFSGEELLFLENVTHDVSR